MQLLVGIMACAVAVGPLEVCLISISLTLALVVNALFAGGKEECLGHVGM